MMLLTLDGRLSGPWPAFPSATCLAFLMLPYLASGSELDGGQVAGVVLGAVGGALLLALLVCLLCYIRVQRRRQTGDLTWAKTGDLEAVATAGAPPGGLTPHEPLPDAAGYQRAAGAGDPAVSTSGGGASGGGGPDRSSCSGPGFVLGPDGAPRTPDSAARSPGQWGPDGPAVSVEAMRASPSEGIEYKKMPSRGRSTGGGALAGILGSGKAFLMRGGNVKDKHLEVSRSARVEPSAELEMAEPFEPAATNMGPPLSKSSMLLRWLQGADDSHAEAVAAQLAAEAAGAGGAAAASPGRGSAAAAAAGVSLRGGFRAHTIGGGGVVGNPLLFHDRLPLLSLAAQQTGIVWSKMPPSVASSPAVSLVESSSMHMLRGTMKRSDVHDELLPAHSHKTATSGSSTAGGGGGGANSITGLLSGGDDRYPPSLSFASVEALRRRSSTQRDRSGIVFDYVSTTPGNSRSATSGGAPSRVPTIGGAVLPLPPVEVRSAGESHGHSDGGGVSGAGGGGGSSTGGVLAAAAAAVAAVVAAGGNAMRRTGTSERDGDSLPLSTPAVAGLDGDGALLGNMPDEHIFAKVMAIQQRQQMATAAMMAAADPSQRSSGVWLHQVPLMKLSALQEAEGEGEVASEVEDGGGAEGGRSKGTDQRGASTGAPKSAAADLQPSISPPAAHVTISPVASVSSAVKVAAAATSTTTSPSLAAIASAATMPPAAAAKVALGPLVVQPSDWTRFSEGGAGGGGGHGGAGVSTAHGGAVAAAGGPAGAVAAAWGSPDGSKALAALGPQTPAAGIPGATSPVSPFLPRPPGSATTTDASISGGGGYGGVVALTSTSDSGAARCTAAVDTAVADGGDGSGGAVVVGLHHIALRGNSETVTTSPARYSTGAVPSPSRPLHSRVTVPSPVQPPSGSESLRSMPSNPASLSPSLGVHFPDLPAPWAEAAATSSPPLPDAATAAAGVSGMSPPPPPLMFPMARGRSLLNDEKALDALVEQASGGWRTAGSAGGGGAATTAARPHGGGGSRAP